MKISRRKFIAGSGAALAGSCLDLCPWGFGGCGTALAGGAADIRGKVFKGDAPDKLWKWARESYIYSRIGNNRVVCGICPNRCLLAPGDRSVCRSRVNLEGTMYSLNYGNPCSIHIDPVEKKPLFHFRPRSRIFSFAATGCSFRCLNCQNWEISQVRPEDVNHYDIFPADMIAKALEEKCRGIAYTYSEATTWFEFMLDTAKLARDKNLANIWVSNGYINQKPLLELCRVLDGANVNLKAYDDAIYRKLNGGLLEPILQTFKILHNEGIHFEMTNLVVPGYVDNDDLVKRMCGWITSNLGPDHPLHFLRFFPKYKLDRLPPTPVSTLDRFRKLAMAEGIRYVYVGNVPGHEGNNTYCHNCGKMLIERKGYVIPSYNLKGSQCRFCNSVIPGVWDNIQV